MWLYVIHLYGFPQKKDYPEKYSVAKEAMDMVDKKSELSNKVKELCSEIESKDGRKVELIKRVIVSTRFNKGTDFMSSFILRLHVNLDGCSLTL